MVGGGDGEVGAAHRTPGQPQAIECLRGGNFVHQVKVNVDQGRLPGFLVNHVGIPNFFEHCPGGHDAPPTVLTGSKSFDIIALEACGSLAGRTGVIYMEEQDEQDLGARAIAVAWARGR